MPPTTARFHGRNARMYASITSGGSATPIVFLSKLELQNSTDKSDGTAFGDTNKISLAGLPNDQGSFSGFQDIAGADFYTAARDGQPRPFYLYPDTVNAPGTYWFGKATFDINFSFDVSATASTSGSFTATTDISRVLA
jgi:hypothetical protein